MSENSSATPRETLPVTTTSIDLGREGVGDALCQLPVARRSWP